MTKKPLEEVEIIGNIFLSGSYTLEFFNTNFDLIAIGEGTVGLIETSGKKE
ncbi:MAG: hypothetical protein ACYTDW_05675 [Planctomycetota bacterium]|jgi:hypothetical protein